MPMCHMIKWQARVEERASNPLALASVRCRTREQTWLRRDNHDVFEHVSSFKHTAEKHARSGGLVSSTHTTVKKCMTSRRLPKRAGCSHVLQHTQAIDVKKEDAVTYGEELRDEGQGLEIVQRVCAFFIGTHSVTLALGASPC